MISMVYLWLIMVNIHLSIVDAPFLDISCVHHFYGDSNHPHWVAHMLVADIPSSVTMITMLSNNNHRSIMVTGVTCYC